VRRLELLLLPERVVRVCMDLGGVMIAASSVSGRRHVQTAMPGSMARTEQTEMPCRTCHMDPTTEV
jgi:hypothetical protein